MGWGNCVSDITKPKKSLFILLLGPLGALVTLQIYFNVRALVAADADSVLRILLIVFWVLFFPLAALFSRHLCRLRLLEDRIETPRLFVGVSCTPWSDVKGIEVYSGRLVMLEAANGRVVVNLSMFERPREILEWIVEHLPDNVEVPASVTDLMPGR
jgi:hypothetical protein